MPHIDDSEQRSMDKLTEFLQNPANFQTDLKPGETVHFRVGNIEGEITLLKLEVKMYGWGGCGNCLGMQAELNISYILKGNRITEQVILAPRPTIQGHGSFLLGMSADGPEKAHISLNVQA
jgi:hypothetical protein